ncbi:MAG: nucleotide-binding universal stress UspA family protein [Myxococcota bacterium]|jgi:nucleotide-binding universal stress UspA family protein
MEDLKTMPNKWLVAHDFSKCAQAALDFALRQLDGQPAVLVLLHVHQPIVSQFPSPFVGSSTTLTDLDSGVLKDAKNQLDATAATVRQQYPKLDVTADVRVGYPPERIVEVAKAENVDLILVGSHGRRGFKRWVLGSVAERVVRLADRPVSVVKTADA